MVIVASLIFAALAALAVFAISVSLKSAAPQIQAIISAVHGKKTEPRIRKVKIVTPLVHSAEIVQLNVPARLKTVDLPEFKVAA